MLLSYCLSVCALVLILELSKNLMNHKDGSSSSPFKRLVLPSPARRSLEGAPETLASSVSCACRHAVRQPVLRRALLPSRLSVPLRPLVERNCFRSTQLSLWRPWGPSGRRLRPYFGLWYPPSCMVCRQQNPQNIRYLSHIFFIWWFSRSSRSYFVGFFWSHTL